MKAIVLSVSGNDLGFGDIITNCVLAFQNPFGRPCYASEQADLDWKMDRAMALLDKAVKDVRFVMAKSGYREYDYRLVVQSYPSPLPRGSEMRYPQGGILGNNRTYQGCPMFDADLNWARDSLVPALSSRIGEIAQGNRADFLDLSDAFQGHEACSKSTRVADAQNRPTSATMDWTRIFNTGVFQGSLEESFHPNAYGQRALGHCLNQWWFMTWPRNMGGAYKCVPGAAGTTRWHSASSADRSVPLAPDRAEVVTAARSEVARRGRDRPAGSRAVLRAGASMTTCRFVE